MDRKDATAWVWSVVAGLLPSQTSTQADLVVAALSVGRVSLAEVGRRLQGTSAEHGIKRCWRFTANRRIEVGDAMSGVVRHLFRAKCWKKKAAVIALDGVEVRNFHTLVAALVRSGRRRSPALGQLSRWPCGRSFVGRRAICCSSAWGAWHSEASHPEPGAPPTEITSAATSRSAAECSKNSKPHPHKPMPLSIEHLLLSAPHWG